MQSVPWVHVLEQHALETPRQVVSSWCQAVNSRKDSSWCVAWRVTLVCQPVSHCETKCILWPKHRKWCVWGSLVLDVNRHLFVLANGCFCYGYKSRLWGCGLPCPPYVYYTSLPHHTSSPPSHIFTITRICTPPHIFTVTYIVSHKLTLVILHIILTFHATSPHTHTHAHTTHLIHTSHKPHSVYRHFSFSTQTKSFIVTSRVTTFSWVWMAKSNSVSGQTLVHNLLHRPPTLTSLPLHGTHTPLSLCWCSHWPQQANQSWPFWKWAVVSWDQGLAPVLSAPSSHEDAVPVWGCEVWRGREWGDENQSWAKSSLIRIS